MTLRIDARVVYCLTVKTVKSMATIAIEFGKETSKKTRKVYLRVNQGKTAKRIKTGVVLSESEFTPKTKKIKCLEKAQLIEKLKKELLENINAWKLVPPPSHPLMRRQLQQEYPENRKKTNWSSLHSRKNGLKVLK